MTIVSNTLEVVLEEASQGPAMQALTEKQRCFVRAMVDQGGLNFRQAAQAAGYLGDANALGVAGHRLAHDPRIQEAIKEVGLKMLHSGAIIAVKTVIEIAGDVTAEKKDRLKASEMIMNRSGMHALTEHKVDVTHKAETTDDMLKRMEHLARTLNLDPQKLLGNVMTDAVYEEVKPEDDLSDLL